MAVELGVKVEVGCGVGARVGVTAVQAARERRMREERICLNIFRPR